MSDDPKREEYYQARLDEAKAQGKDYVLYTYRQFAARFAQCVHCDWIEYLTEGWEDDDEQASRLLTHTIREHRA